VEVKGGLKYAWTQHTLLKLFLHYSKIAFYVKLNGNWLQMCCYYRK